MSACCGPNGPTIQITQPGPPDLDPADCNAARASEDGLLVPATRIAGVTGPAPARVADNLQSVDVVVDPPPPDACPQNWRVQAYLTPVRGSVAGGADVNLLPTRASGTWRDTPLVARLPHPGVYFVSADVLTQICATLDTGGATNLWTTVRVVTDAGTVPLGVRIGTQHEFSTAPDTRFQACSNATASLSGLVAVTAAQGSVTIRVQALLIGPDPTGGATIESSNYRGSRSRLTWFKIAD